ncbi:hypothetical protein EYF80_002219 [Liparis tanakae]|uniref:Uncharacterized protein n=1 Tax=Liparis tanakae TaxID=230148 RepID=A0A4Z2JE37_9TELE|nr:hypothetical protein EYF80_002219 [Liparis tanakae]
MDTPMAMMTRPMQSGSMPLGAPMFFLSVMARMHRINGHHDSQSETNVDGQGLPESPFAQHRLGH